jgi:hypothetical protein
MQHICVGSYILETCFKLLIVNTTCMFVIDVFRVFFFLINFGLKNYFNAWYINLKTCSACI